MESSATTPLLESVMLILSRREREEIVIGEKGEIVVKVLTVYPEGGVKLGIQADKSIPVHRREVYDQLKSHGALSLTAESKPAAE